MWVETTVFLTKRYLETFYLCYKVNTLIKVYYSATFNSAYIRCFSKGQTFLA